MADLLRAIARRLRNWADALDARDMCRCTWPRTSPRHGPVEKCGVSCRYPEEHHRFARAS